MNGPAHHRRRSRSGRRLGICPLPHATSAAAPALSRTGRLAALPHDAGPAPDAIGTETAWLGDGYAHPTAAGDRALDRASAQAGLTPERTYTAEALAALLDLDATGRLDGDPLPFLRTHGPR
ncbi:hypothetical protein [Streptomyces sp. NPDC002463]|uniref:hypothetical protein n=1 Tax=Streptomyces sp. NPDC002463 TaxID=3364645 RepID=UPI0036C9CFA2